MIPKLDMQSAQQTIARPGCGIQDSAAYMAAVRCCKTVCSHRYGQAKYRPELGLDELTFVGPLGRRMLDGIWAPSKEDHSWSFEWQMPGSRLGAGKFQRTAIRWISLRAP